MVTTLAMTQPEQSDLNTALRLQESLYAHARMMSDHLAAKLAAEEMAKLQGRLLLNAKPETDQVELAKHLLEKRTELFFDDMKRKPTLNEIMTMRMEIEDKVADGH